MRKQINRQSTMQQITEETGVDEELILKFIKQKDSDQPASKFGISLRKVRKSDQDGKFCKSCQTDIESQLDHMNQNSR